MSEQTKPSETSESGEEKQYATEAEEIAALQADAEQKTETAESSDSSESREPADVVAELRRQVEALTADLQRERAEFANFRKRAIAEKAQQAAQTSARLLTDLLPALDALDQFFAAYLPKADSDASIKAIVDGVQLVHRQITRVFTESGVEEFNPVGSEFDPNIMEALSMQEADVEKQTVTQVFQKGYRIEGKIIRPARVVVARPRAKENS